VLNPYMVGGSWFSNRPMLETVRLCEEIAAKKSNRSYPGPSCKGTTPGLRSASKSKSHYHEWESKYDVGDMLGWIHTKATNNVLEIDPNTVRRTGHMKPSSQRPRFSRTAIRVVSYLLVLLPALLGFLYVRSFGVNLVYSDSWALVTRFCQVLVRHVGLSDL
jgi:hypothetical protein